MTEIRLIGPDRAGMRRGRGESAASTAPSPGNLNPLIRSVAGASIEQIDLIFLELQRVRDVLHSEGARLGHEIASYGNLNQSILATMKVIRESLTPIADNGNTPRA
ncbi:MAG TPA: hypothetical protein VGG01_24875 [Xanthobacteraceae bacterium]|jgi:hypothetical protein